MSISHADIVVIGAGVAGLSAAAEIARSRRVFVLERESQPGFHATGRSAALFFETYGSNLVRALTRASRTFYETPPAGFASYPLLETCGALFIARSDQMAILETFAAEEDIRRTGRVVSRDAALEICPVLRKDYVAAALFDPAPASIDVASLLEGYRRQLRERGGHLSTNAEVTGLTYDGDVWRISTAAGEFSAGIVIDAAGAWADQIAICAGIDPVGLEPRRRTALLARADGAEALTTRALILDIEEQFYFRAEGGGVLISPADQTLSPACDAQPEEIDIAVAIDRVTAATTLEVHSIRSKWAGLRSFVADRNPVVGFAPGDRRFFWLAAQGGYGIQTAPALAELAACLVLDRPISERLALTPAQVARLSPARLA